MQSEKRKAWSKQYYLRNRERMLAYSRKWQRENPEKLKAIWERQRKKDPEANRRKWREYRMRNPDKVRATVKAYRARTRDRWLAHGREYYRSHREYYASYHKAWVAKHPQEAKAIDAKQYALRKGAKATGRVTAEDWAGIKRQYAFKCAICFRRKKLERDHVKPLSKGGDHTPSNIQPLCRSCNSSKGNRLI